MTRAIAASLVAVTLAATAPVVAGQSTANAPQVLFICPHGAAKSVMASAYFQKLARERGLNVRVDAAGTGDVPDFSANFDVAEQAIRDQVTRLVDELVAQAKAKK
jgi:hypothetical protein